MSVRHLGRIADRLRRNGGIAAEKHFFGRRRRQFYPKAQMSKKREPQRIVLVHIQCPRNADRAVNGFFFRKGFVMIKQAGIFICAEVDFVIFDFAGAPFAFIAGNELLFIAEIGDCQHTMVGTTLTSGVGGLDIQIFDFFRGDKSCFNSVFRPAFSGNQRRAESAHQTGEPRPDNRFANLNFQSPEKRVV